MPVHKSTDSDGMINYTFDQSDAKAKLLQCLESTKLEADCALIELDILKMAYDFQKALDWFHSPVKTSDELKKITSALNSFDRSLGFAIQHNENELASHLYDSWLNLKIRECFLISNRFRRDFLAVDRPEEYSIDDYREHCRNLSPERLAETITDKDTKLLSGFFRKYLRIHKESKGITSFLACLYRDHLPQARNNKQIKTKSLAKIWDENARNLLRVT